MSPPVLLIAENGDSGGIGRYCVDLAGLLGHGALVVCLCPEPCTMARACWLAGQCENRGVQLLRVTMPKRGWRAGLSGLVRLWKQLGRPLIHVNGTRGNAVAVAARMSVPKLRYVTTVHGVLGLHSRRNVVYRIVDWAAGRAASAVIAVSADTGRRVIRSGKPAARTHLIPNGLADGDMDALRAVADGRTIRGNGKPLRLGFLGRLSPEKGTRELVEVSRRLSGLGAKATVVIAGDGPDRDSLVAESRSMIDSGFMRYHGVVQDAASFLGEVDVLVMPSHNEGMPYVLLEGMAAGCAVVAFAVGGIPEVVRDPSLGVLVQPGDTEGLVAALGQLCDAPAVAASIGKAASEHVREHFALRSRLPLITQAYSTANWRAPGSGVRSTEGWDE